jgi:hypothetical protein
VSGDVVPGGAEVSGGVVPRGAALRALRVVVATLAAGVALGAVDASALTLDARTGDTGWIDFAVTGRPGTTVTVTEANTPVATIPLREERAEKRRAVPWRCDAPARTFVASDGTETATAEVRTPTCRDRLAIATTPFSPKAGKRLIVRVRDHWRLGDVTARVCLGRTCRTARIRPGRRTVNVRVRTGRRGIKTVTATAPWGQRLTKTVEVRRGRMTVLATGDSMIQILDTDLKRRLKPRGVRLKSDAHISTGISKPFQLDWVALARRQALADHPTATVVFLGANDGFPIGGTSCCGAEWIQRYAARVKRMMASYRRRGAARVYWLNLPAPRKPGFARIFRAVNAALALAEPALQGSGRIVDLARVFTPGGRFRSTLGGRVVRQADGVHLNVRGAAIAAGLVMRELRRDGVVP